MPPTISNLTSGSDPTNLNVGGTYTTAAVQANNGEIIILDVSIERSTLNPTAPTISGGGVTTWNTLIGQVFDGSGSTRARQDIFWGVSDGSSAAIVITVSDAATSNGNWIVDKIADGNSTTPFTQNKLATGSGESISATLDSAMDANARPYAFIAKAAGTGAITPRTNWTELAETAASENEIVETQWRSGATETTGSGTWTGTNVAGIIVAEVAAGGLSVSPGLIDQSGVVFAPQINQTVSLGLIDQTGQVFSPSIGGSVSPGLIDQAGQVFAPQINLGVSPPLIDQSGVVFAPEVSGAGVQVVSPALIDQSGVVFAPQVNLGISVGLIDQTGVVFTPQINLGVSVGLISQAGVVFAPQLNLGVSPALINQSGVVFEPVISGGAELAAVGARAFINMSRW